MIPSLTETLCSQCGLCCDGTLFADVELRGGTEATRLEILGLEVEDDGADGALLPQPCTALSGRRCGIYVHRPECCRTFECRLLGDVLRGAVSVKHAEAHIADVLDRIGRIEELLGPRRSRDRRLPLKERCAEALAGKTGRDPQGHRRSTELAAVLAAVERAVRGKFLGDVGGK